MEKISISEREAKIILSWHVYKWAFKTMSKEEQRLARKINKWTRDIKKKEGTKY